ERDSIDRLDGADLALEYHTLPDREVLDEVADLDQRARGGTHTSAPDASEAPEAGSVVTNGGAAGSTTSLLRTAGDSPATSRFQTRARTSGSSRHATSWPGSPGTGSRLGSIRVWDSRAYGHRGWKKHPLGRLIRLGGRP